MLTVTEEREIVTTCQVLQELGFGLTREIVSEVISDFLRGSARPSLFTGGLPGPDWWVGFMQRWPTLSERKPQHLSSARAACANPTTVDSWFTRVRSFCSDKGLLKSGTFVHDYEQRIWNCDETGFCLGVTSKKVLARKGMRAVHEVGGSSDHQYITVNVVGNAAGVPLPPFVLYKGKNLYNTWTEGGPAGAFYGVSQSGWMEELNFSKWFELQFYPAVKYLTETGPVVLFFDGHYSHLGIPLIKKARTFGIHLFCLPPNTTHILQPLDVGVFGPVKSAWRKILKQYKVRTRAANVTKDIFPSLLKELWEKSIKPEHLRGGFKSAGLAPFNPDAISQDRLSPSLVTSSGTPPEMSPQSQPTTPPLRSVTFNGVGTLHVGGTPIRVELRAYFVKALQPADKRLGERRRRRVELSDHGEVLTSDQVLERLEQAEAEKARKAEEEKARKAAEKARKAAEKARKAAEKARKAAEKKSGKKGKNRAAKTSTASQEPDSVHCGVSSTRTMMLRTGSAVTCVSHGITSGVRDWNRC